MRGLLFSLIIFGFYFCFAQSNPFTEVTFSAGIDHSFEVDLATFGGGVAVIDIDKDGFEDLYLVGGKSPDALYKNNGDGTFTDVITTAGFESTLDIYTQGVSAGDINKDGFKDLIITTMHFLDDRSLAPNLLYLNNGDNTFSEVTGQYGLTNLRNNSQGASFGDVNGDGFIDLYISNYFSNSSAGFQVFNEQTITNSFDAAMDYLLINAGGKSFIDVSQRYGLVHEGFGFVGLFTDFDNDDDLDLYIANDFGFRRTPNVFLRNEFPEEKYQDRSVNVALNFGMNAMGIASCDCNHDGWMDYFVSNLGASLFAVNAQNGDPFLNRTESDGLAIETIVDPLYTGPPVSWGANFFDFDHDLDEDLFVANGALNPTVRLNPNFFFESDNGSFEEVSQSIGMNDYRIARGSVVFDYDNDGDLDLFVVNQQPRDPIATLPPARSLLYRNNTNSGNWLKVKLEGVNGDLDGIGSKIEVRVGSDLLVREINGGSSHLSHNSPIAHFGLADYSEVSSITVKWLGGEEQTLTNVDVNQQITITETLAVPTAEQVGSITVFPTYFDQEAIIQFTAGSLSNLVLEVHNDAGKLIDTVNLNSGDSAYLTWQAPYDLPRGVYFFSLKSDESKVVTRGIRK